MGLIMKSLDWGFKKSSPCIALVGKTEKSGFSFSEPVNLSERNIDIIPVRVKCEKNKIYLPPEMIVLSPGCTSTRMVMSGNRLKNILESRGAVSYSFYFFIPPEFANIEPEEITVNFSYRNQGGNIVAQPLLSKNSKEVNPEAKAVKNRAEYIKTMMCRPKSESDGRYVFKGDDIKAVIDKVTGKGFLLIDAREKNEKLTAEQKIRANKWAPASLTIEIKGKVPEEMTTFKY